MYGNFSLLHPSHEVGEEVNQGPFLCKSLWMLSREPKAALSSNCAQPLVLFLSFSIHECWLQTTCSRSSGQYPVNPAPEVCTSYGEKEIGGNALKSTQNEATASKCDNRLPIYTELQTPDINCCLVFFPLHLTFLHLPFPTPPFWFSTSGNFKHHWEEVGHDFFFSGSPAS